MKHRLVLLGLRVLAVAFSVSLLGGYVWFTQRKAQPPVMLPSEEFVHYGEPVEAAVQDAAGHPQTVMLGTKSFSQPIFSTRKVEEAAKSVQPPASKLMMPGSKSFTGAVTVVASQLQMETSAEPASPTSKVVVMPRAGGGNGTVVPGTIDERIADAQIKPAPRSVVVMPGSKISRVFIQNTASPKKPSTESGKPRAMMPGSKSGALELEVLWTQFVRMPSEVVNPDPFAPNVPQQSPPPPLHSTRDAPPPKRIIMSGSKSALLEIPVSRKTPAMPPKP